MTTTFLQLKQILHSSKDTPNFTVKNSASKKLCEELQPLPFKYTRCGIEVEVENMPMGELKVANILSSIMWWKISNDPSLRNHGLEFQSPGPIAGEEDVGKALAELRDALGKYKLGDFSFRTGIHVHLCLLKFGLPQVLNFFTGYNFIEPYLFEAFCPQRRFSNFCVPFGANGPESGRIGKIFHEMNEAYSSKNYTYNWTAPLLSLWSSSAAAGGTTNYSNKYSAINPSRIRDIGTVEFRHLPGTDDFILLKDWISTITSLADFSFSLEFNKFSNLICKASTIDKIKRIFNKIIPKEIHRPVPDAILLDGVRQAKTFLLGVKSKIRKDEPIHVKKTGKLMKVAEEISKLRATRLRNNF